MVIWYIGNHFFYSKKKNFQVESEPSSIYWTCAHAPCNTTKISYSAAEVNIVIIKLNQTPKKSLHYAWELSSPTRIRPAQHCFIDTPIPPCLLKVQHSASSSIDFEDMLDLTR